MKWHEKSYSRMLIDNHISDEDPTNMSHFSGETYAEMIELAGLESSMVYSCDHNGNCYYPTKVGHMHAGLQGRDAFGETVAALRRKNISPVAYYSVIFHNDSAKRLPQARIRDISGIGRTGRYHFTCPNHPDALAFFQAQLAEILTYDIDGIFIDMSFWPLVCLCDSCRKRFGKPIPEIIDWDDPQWITFQRFRETSMAEFAMELTGSCKKIRPEVSITHQFSPVLHGWRMGHSSAIAAACDYSSGDFYGGKRQQRLGTKVFAAYSKYQPYEFMTSRCNRLRDHTSTKSADELFIHALTTLANAGAYFFIDAINPDGTLEKKFYTQLGEIVKKLRPYRDMIARHHPRLEAKVGLYFSMESGSEEHLNGVHLANYDDPRSNMDSYRYWHLDETTGAADSLNRLHVPFEVVTDTMTDLSKFKVIIIANARFMSREECQRLRDFVAAGGTLIATGKTSLMDWHGHTTGNFALADVFGVRYSGRDSGKICYTKDEENTILSDIPAPLVTADTASVLARINMPDYPWNDPEHYASIHSNPPGKTTSDHAAISVNRFGKGTCLYIAANFMMLRQHSQQTYTDQLLKPYLPAFVTVCENLPPSVEVTWLRSGTGNAMLLGVVNYQEELPNIPLHDVKIEVDAGFIPSSIIRASDGEKCAFAVQGKNIVLQIPVLENGEIFEFNY